MAKRRCSDPPPTAVDSGRSLPPAPRLTQLQLVALREVLRAHVAECLRMWPDEGDQREHHLWFFLYDVAWQLADDDAKWAVRRKGLHHL